MKKENFLTFLLISTLLVSACKRDKDEFKQFDNLFDPSIPDTLKTSTVSFNNPGDTAAMGKKIEARYFHLFKFPDEFMQYKSDSSKIQARAFKKITTGSYTEYLVVFYNPEVRVPHFICLYSYHTISGKMSDPLILDYAYGSEGTEDITQSWLLDINKDGKKDIIMRTYECNLLGTDAKVGHFIDTLNVSVWTDSSFKNISVPNYKKLKAGFSLACACLCGSKE